MANKLAGQRAKFSRARATYYSTNDDTLQRRAAQLMAEVLAQAPANGFSEDQVTQGEDVPDDARHLSAGLSECLPGQEDDPDRLVAELQSTVETTDVIEIGQGEEFVYAYGYKCAPDRLKIGCCSGDVISRIAAQIGTGTPDKPVLTLRIRTNDCRALERTIHGMFQLKGRRITGAGAEWFLATRDEVLAAYESAIGWSSSSDGEARPDGVRFPRLSETGR